MKKILVFIFVLFSANSYSQDTIRMMQYNLMYYEQTSSYCTASKKYAVDSGYNTLNIPADFLDNGMYYLTITTTQGNKSFPFVVMK